MSQRKRSPSKSQASKSAPQAGKCGCKANDLGFGACGPLIKALGVDLPEIEGIDVGMTLVILAEIGVAFSHFPTEKHFASWLEVFPRVYQSNKSQTINHPVFLRQQKRQFMGSGSASLT